MTMGFSEAYNEALRFLRVRFLSEAEMRDKLTRKGIDGRLADAVVGRLKEERLLDDCRLARSVYRYYRQKEQYGHRYICNKLRQRHLPIPADAEPGDEYETACRLLRRRFGEETPDIRKISRFLAYRGFSGAVIRAVMETYFP